MKITDDFLLIEDTDKIYDTKIYSSRYASLLGKDDFKKPGDALLEMWKLIEKEPFDQYYSLRGEIAEHLAEKEFKKNGLMYKYFGKDASHKKVFDLFENNKVFGGVYDFLVFINGKKYNFEIKATSVKNKPYVPQLPHVKQVELVSFLGNLDFGKIIYYFFTPEQEEFIKKHINEPSLVFEEAEYWKVENIEIDVPLNAEEIKKDMLNVFNLVDECKKDKKIPIQLLSENVLNKLGYKKPIDIFVTKDFTI